MNEKSILIISSNPMSNVFNNGKTLNAFFDKYPKDKIAQLYFAATLPDSDICSTYFRISDVDMLNLKLKRSQKCGEKVEAIEGTNVQTKEENTVRSVKKNNFTRLLREALWCSGWDTKELRLWLDEFRPEIVFFLAGDVVYAHKICRYIVTKYHTKMAMYITDDYILPRKNPDIFGFIRRRLIKKWMKKSVQSCDALFTISEPMRVCYKEMFGKDSFVAANMYEPDERENKAEGTNENIIITYAGGLHYNRHLTIMKIVAAIKKINEKNIGKKIILKIYSGSVLKQKDMEEFSKSDCCIWGGLLDSEALEKELKQSDFLLHVESFKKSNICDTKLSLSTKIPEYMSYHKPIIAIGPKEVASMKYLEDCACCVTDLKDILPKLEKSLYDDKLTKKLADEAYNKYLARHDKKKIQPEIMRIIDAM